MICLTGWMTAHALGRVPYLRWCWCSSVASWPAAALPTPALRHTVEAAQRQLWTCCCAEVHEMNAILQGAAVRCAATMTRQIASDCAQQARWCVADDALLCSSASGPTSTPPPHFRGVQKTELSKLRPAPATSLAYSLHSAVPLPLLQTLCERAAQQLPSSARAPPFSSSSRTRAPASLESGAPSD